MHTDWQKTWAEMTDEERTNTGIIVEEHILKHGKCYTVRGRDNVLFTIREDGFVAGNIHIENEKPMTCENFVRLLAEFARAARFFEWTEDDKKNGRAPQTSLMGKFMGWGDVPSSTFAELPTPVKCLPGRIKCWDCSLCKNSKTSPCRYCRFDSIVRNASDECKYPGLRSLFIDDPDAPLVETVERALSNA